MPAREGAIEQKTDIASGERCALVGRMFPGKGFCGHCDA